MKIGINEANNYGSNGGGGFFSLKDDKDTARVRFLYDNIDDVEGFAVHEVEVDGKKRAVNCLREYGAPLDDCPFCKKGYPVRVKYYVPLVQIKDGKTVLWERGKKFGQKLSSMCARYPHLYSHIFEIERNGKAGDQQTTYEIYEVGQDDANINDFEVQNPLGTVVLDKTAEDMQYFIDRGVFMDDGNSSASDRRDTSEPIRRTPSNSSGRREVF